MQHFWFKTKQSLSSISVRRLRNLPMLFALALLFALMSVKASVMLGAPYLFWHDNFFTLLLSFAAVGYFLEEWAYVGILLDTDVNNPLNSPSSNSKISLLGNVRAYLGLSENEGTDQVYAMVRQIHTYATFGLVAIFMISSAIVYQLTNERLSWYGIPHVFIPVAAAYLTFKFRVLILENKIRLSSFFEWMSRCLQTIPVLGKILDKWFLEDVNNREGEFHDFHLIAIVKNNVAILLFSILTILYWNGLYFQYPPSVAAIVCGLLAGFIGIYGWIVFQKGRLKYEVISFGFLLMGFVVWLGSGNVAKEVRLALDKSEVIPCDHDAAIKQIANAVKLQNDNRDKWISEIGPGQTASGTKFAKTEQGLLQNWQKRASQERLNGAVIDTTTEKPILVLVSNTGGGIKAQVWSTVVLQAIEQHVSTLDGKKGNPIFSRHVRLVTGASGGMVGAGYWVATLTEEPTANDFHDTVTVENMIQQMSRDCLSHVARQGFYNDILGLPLRLLNVKLPTRGEALEESLIESGREFGEAFSNLKKGEDEGWRPTLVYTPTCANDGRQFLICNQPLEYLFHSQFGDRHSQEANSVQPIDNKNENEVTGEQDIDDYQSSSIYSWKLNYPGSKMKLATAARLSGNFPIFVDSPYLPFKANKKRTRIMDAGYLDNHGVYPAAAWLQANRQWVANHTSGVLLLEISAAELPRNENQSPEGGSLPEAYGFVNTSFNKTLFHTDRVLSQLSKDFKATNDQLPEDFFKVLSFQYTGDASLSWYLSDVEKFSLLYPFLSDSQLESLQTLREFEFAKAIENDLITFDQSINESNLISGIDRFPFYRNTKKKDDPRPPMAQKLLQLKSWWEKRSK